MMRSTHMLSLGVVLMVSGFLFTIAIDEAIAGSKTMKLRCQSTGTFLTSSEADPLSAGASVSSASGNCNIGLGRIGSYGVLQTGTLTMPNCIAFASATRGTQSSPSVLYNEQGDSILYEVTNGEQCFFDANGVATPLATTPFCLIVGPGDATDPTSIHFSTSTADFTVISESDISRFQSTGKFDNATGSGTIISEASLCDRSFPLANHFTSTLEGTITVPE